MRQQQITITTPRNNIFTEAKAPSGTSHGHVLIDNAGSVTVTTSFTATQITTSILIKMSIINEKPKLRSISQSERKEDKPLERRKSI